MSAVWTILERVLTLIYFGSAHRAVNAVDRFGTYLALGTTSLIAVQAIFNVLVVRALPPTTGIPLPFFTRRHHDGHFSLTTLGLLVLGLAALCGAARTASAASAAAPPAGKKRGLSAAFFPEM